jgi:hypothetical protein
LAQEGGKISNACIRASVHLVGFKVHVAFRPRVSEESQKIKKYKKSWSHLKNHFSPRPSEFFYFATVNGTRKQTIINWVKKVISTNRNQQGQGTKELSFVLVLVCALNFQKMKKIEGATRQNGYQEC